MKLSKTSRIFKYTAALSATLLLYIGCSISYSTTGASIPEAAQTYSVSFFPNQATFVNPNLSQQFTEFMKEFFARQTRLSLIQRNGDVHFEGEIVEYNIHPMAITGDATAAETRMTIGINVRYYNTLDEESDFEEKFTAYADFESSQSLQDVENDLIEEIITQICENVFNKAFTDW